MHRCPHDSCHHAAVASAGPERTPFLVHGRGRVSLHTGLGVPLVLFCTLYNTLICGRKSGEADALSRRVCPSIQGPSTRDPQAADGQSANPHLVPPIWQHCPSVRPRGHTPSEGKKHPQGRLIAPSYTRQPLKGPIQGPGLNGHTLTAGPR